MVQNNIYMQDVSSNVKDIVIYWNEVYVSKIKNKRDVAYLLFYILSIQLAQYWY